MTANRNSGFGLLLAVAAAFGCSISLFSGTVAVLDYSAQSAIESPRHA